MESPMRAGIDEYNAVARKDRAQRRDRGCGVDRLRRPLAIFEIIEARSGRHFRDEGLPLCRAICKRRRRAG